MKKPFRAKIPALILLGLIILLAALYVAFFTSLPEKWGWKKKAESAVVLGKCAGYDLTLDEVRYVTLLYKKEFENRYGADVWQSDESIEAHRAELEETVKRELKNNYAILACAKEYLPQEELDDKALTNTVDRQMEEFKEYYGDSFDEVLAEQNLTEAFFRFILWTDAVQTKLYEKLDEKENVIGFSDVSAFYNWLREGNCVYAQYVYLSNDEGEDPEENRKLAESIQKDLSEGGEIGSYIGSAINDDLTNVAPRYFVNRLCEKSVWEALKSLMAPGDACVAKTEKGFYVFQAAEETDGLLEARASDLFDDWKTLCKSELAESFLENLTIEWNERGAALDFATLQ